MAARQFGSLTCGSSEIGTVRSVRNRNEPQQSLRHRHPSFWAKKTSVFSGFQVFITRLGKAEEPVVPAGTEVPMVGVSRLEWIGREISGTKRNNSGVFRFVNFNHIFKC